MAQQIGVAKVVQGHMNALGTEGSRSLAVGNPVFKGDTIATGKGSGGSIEFLDHTVLNVGEGSKVSLDQYVYNPDKGSGHVLFKMAQGSFRTVTGEIVKHNPESFKLQSPLATIGIRGTEVGTVIPLPGHGSENFYVLVFDGKAVTVQALGGGAFQVLGQVGAKVEVNQFGTGPMVIMTPQEYKYFSGLTQESLQQHGAPTDTLSGAAGQQSGNVDPKVQAAQEASAKAAADAAAKAAAAAAAKAAADAAAKAAAGATDPAAKAAADAAAKAAADAAAKAAIEAKAAADVAAKAAGDAFAAQQAMALAEAAKAAADFAAQQGNQLGTDQHFSLEPGSIFTIASLTGGGNGGFGQGSASGQGGEGGSAGGGSVQIILSPGAMGDHAGDQPESDQPPVYTPPVVPTVNNTLDLSALHEGQYVTLESENNAAPRSGTYYEPTQNHQFWDMTQHGGGPYSYDDALVTAISSSILNVVGTEGSDTIYGNSQANIITPDAGADTVSTGAGNDMIIMGEHLNDADGQDQIDGGQGLDILSFTDNDYNSTTNDLDTVTGVEVVTLGNATTNITFHEGQAGNAGFDDNAWAAVGRHISINGALLDAGHTLTFDGSSVTEYGSFNIVGGSGADTLTGANAATDGHGQDLGDNIAGGGGNDHIEGLAGNDYLSGGVGDDTILGDLGNDTISGGSGDDTINAGDGDDLVSGGAGSDTLDGGADTDTLSYADETSPITLNLDQGTISTNGDVDHVSNFEHIIGTSGNDTVWVNASPGNLETLDLGEGTDTMIFADVSVDMKDTGNNPIALAGVDKILFKDGESTDNTFTVTMYGSQLSGKTMTLGLTDRSNTDDHNHTLEIKGNTALPNDIDLRHLQIDSNWNSSTTGKVDSITITGGSGTDTIIGTAAAETINGDAGNDALSGSAGNDTINGGDGDDTISGGSGSNTLDGGDDDGEDTLTYTGAASPIIIDFKQASITSANGDHDSFQNFERFVGTAGNDTVHLNTSLGDLTSLDMGGGTNTMIVSFDGLELYYSDGTPVAITGVDKLLFQDGTVDDHDLKLTMYGSQLSGKTMTLGLTDRSNTDDHTHTLEIKGDLTENNSIDLSNISIDSSWNSSNHIDPGDNKTDSITITGGSGTDTIIGTAAADTINGDAGNDALSGGAGNDIISGGDGDDTIRGGAGDDLLHGGDSAEVNGDKLTYADDSIAGHDELDGVIVTASSGNIAVQDIFGGTDIVDGFEQFVGSIYNDTFNMQTADLSGSFKSLDFGGDTDTDTLHVIGYGGVAKFGFPTGSGTLDLSISNLEKVVLADGMDLFVTFRIPVITGQHWNIDTDGATHDHTISVRGGDDSATSVDLSHLTFGANWNSSTSGKVDSITIAGGSHDDTIIGSSYADTILSGGGNDIIDAGKGDDIINMAPENTPEMFSADHINGGDGHDTLYYASHGASTDDLDNVTNVEQINVSGGTTAYITALDTLAGVGKELGVSATGMTAGGLHFDGHAVTGNLTINGSDYADDITGGQGHDTINGKTGDDTVHMGLNLTNQDELHGNDDDDTLTFAAKSHVNFDLTKVDGFEHLVLDNTDTSAHVTLTGDNFEGVTANWGAKYSGITVDGSNIDASHSLTFDASGITSPYAYVRFVDVTGGHGDDTITGTNSYDATHPALGDILTGGGGADTLTGGDGADTFVYKATSDGCVTTTNVSATDLGTHADTITDFTSGSDVLKLVGNDFNLANGTLTAGTNFVVLSSVYDGTTLGGATCSAWSGGSGAVIVDSAHHVIYDANGSGEGYTVLATLDATATVLATDVMHTA